MGFMAFCQVIKKTQAWYGITVLYHILTMSRFDNEPAKCTLFFCYPEPKDITNATVSNEFHVGFFFFENRFNVFKCIFL